MVWLQFVVCAGLVVLVGSLLSRYADILAEKTGLGRSLIGGVLLAGATSLPELTSGVSAVAIVGDTDLAAGGIFGSCLFNLLLIVLLDLLSGATPLLRRAEVSQTLAATISGALLALAMLGIYLSQTLGLPTLGWIGLPSVAIVVAYGVGVRVLARFEQRRISEVLAREAVVRHYDAIPLWRAGLVFALLALAIMGLGLWLATLGDRIAASTGLGTSFVGAIFLAGSTSLPEIVAALAALRLGAVDLAVSNIFGSNMFNILLLAIYDLTYRRGDLWTMLAPIHGFSAVAAALMTAVAVVGLIYRRERRPRAYLGWEAILLLLLYLGSLYVIYRVPV